MVSIGSGGAGVIAATLEIGVTPISQAGIRPQLKVLQVFHSLGMGGAETWLMSMLKYFREAEEQLGAGIKCDILLTGGARAVFDDQASQLGARLFYVPFRRDNLVGFTRKFRRILAEGKYDAIHDHQDYVAGLHFLAGLGQLPAVRVAHVHNTLYQRAPAGSSGKAIVNSLGQRSLARLATHVVGTSRQILTEYGFDSKRFRNVFRDAVHCGFDIELYQGDSKQARAELCRELGCNEAAKIILFVGRLESPEATYLGRAMTHKNPALALEIASECVARDPSVQLVMVGAGESKQAEFEAQVRQAGLAKNIHLLGPRFDVPELMQGSDLLLFPSLAEGLGMAVVEAQAAGLRVLASDTTPRESVVIPESVEFLSLGAPVAQWATAALRLLDLSRIDARKCNSAVRESPFSIANSAARLFSIYGNNAQFVKQGAG